mmetsp:Transcript_39807/g.100337  ORF Transcript_39807/g.100337 Transcript_39807/m.100337 type:complete len:460 (-) Transcript_39807:203-1582(-)
MSSDYGFNDFSSVKDVFRFGKVHVVLLAGVLIGLISGSPNAVNIIANDLKDDQDLSDFTISFMTSFGVIGLFLTMPAGVLNDRYGAWIVAVVGSVLLIGGLTVMTFTSKSTVVLMIISYTVAGFGSGAAFICALSAAIKALPARPGLAVALVGGSLSLSLALIVQSWNLYGFIFDCDGHPSCWRGKLRLIAWLGGGISLASSFLLYFIPTHQQIADYAAQTRAEKGAEEQEALLDDGKEEEKKNTPTPMKETVRILLNVFFWCLTFGYFAGIASGILIIAETTNMWEAFVGYKDEGTAGYISTTFSVLNICCNLLSGWLSDLLLKKYGVERRKCLTVVGFFFGALCIIAGCLTFVTNPSNGTKVVYFILMAAGGGCFGSSVTLYPTVVGEQYGHIDFGVYFGYLQIGSCAATLIIPVMATATKEAMGNFAFMYFFVGGCLILSAILLFLKKPTPVGVAF